MSPDPTALPSKATAVVVLLADAAVSVAEEVEAADLRVVTEVDEVVAVEVTTATSVVNPVTWRETVLKAVEDTEVVVVVTEEVAAMVEEVVATEEAAVEVVAAVEAATAVASRDISPGTAPAVDVDRIAGPAVENVESVISHMVGRSLFSPCSISLYYPLFAYYDGSLLVGFS